MAGLGEYGDEGFSSYHAKKNPFVMMQSVSTSPNKFLPLLGLGAKLLGGKLLGGALAKTAIGTAVKGIGTKLATSGIGKAVVKGAKWLGKKVIKPVKEFTSKVFGGKKPNIGNVSSTASPGTGTQWGSGASKSQISTIKQPSSFSDIASKTTKIKPSTSKIGDFVKKKAKEVPSRVFASMDAQAKQKQAEAESRIESSGKYTSSIPPIGNTSSRVPEEDFESI